MKRGFFANLLLALAVGLTLFLALFPFYYAVLTSLKSGTALFRVDYLPRHLSPANYINVLQQGNFPVNVLNSVLVSLTVVVLSLLLAVMAAYALGRVRFRGRGVLLLTILSVSMFPQIVVLSGLFEIVRAMGIYNTMWALIFTYMIITLPFTVWVLTTFMRALPLEIEEAAIMDGATPWITVTRVFLPLLWPAMVTTGLLAFIAAWNEFLFALTFVLTNDQRTVPVAIALLSGATQHETPWGIIMAASVMVTVPLVVLVLVFQKKIVSGLTAGAVKG